MKKILKNTKKYKKYKKIQKNIKNIGKYKRVTNAIDNFYTKYFKIPIIQIPKCNHYIRAKQNQIAQE